jgi:hypothetical protein
MGKRFSTLGLSLVMLLSVIIVNLRYKNGLAIPKSSNVVLQFRDSLNARNIDKTIYFKITSMVNTVTEENLITIHCVGIF